MPFIVLQLSRREKESGCIALLFFGLLLKCPVALPRSVVDGSAVCDCGIS